jgi:hypothetical protein
MDNLKNIDIKDENLIVIKMKPDPNEAYIG